ncbi:DUF4919 domain-containing protein [Microbulbifer thermotolerans]|uniref:DUF4919 domain-containing protein n=1 Tax=Microbulbifer thermotolerans TaxID=252514 RepID=A0A143HML9_MICTH|nr:DUF4919 domain-containing protein [Microbulbifer thermotolerans]AMX02720.1 hypothetical protein A3224_09110 [Microbulbifer thermotolerans]MCX2779573.1 DUF4919 domain-containing protein [Microbulbifer thermotolerans]MCX2782538.1 DUF4919 domain-containing protein [Microbulbifer thermotolerans]MCX2794551.1 DUF4919 domain-containing protein [Microbulbifer thermotolerans]MCX2801378.1 DUF4919 domain-containing protein [Microbulbifer thermotolerans]
MATRNLKRIGIAALLGTVVFLSACSSSAGKSAPQLVLPQAEESEYRRLLAQARALSFTLDFDQLRRAYVASPEYNPRGGAELVGLTEAYRAEERGEYGECLKQVDRVLDVSYMSLEAHMIGVLCAARSANLQREDIHRYMTEGLMDSIERSGDGRSQESAYQTISTSELNGFVRLKGLEVLDQSIVYDQRGIYDKIQVRNLVSGDEYALYFNVSRQFVHGVESAAD